ncbi:dienelactone hydrolase family protein [Haloplanus aerogenes]|uniref:Alpha/beta hydrolase n=1 Tax=Haloplanus aerogenes TaxID=660522 RepID=A0A3M0EAX6_9EURY|nr:alpha/beta family hydrolase [Haloplanus aerogenes]AZH25497.1 alpha/beta hydrolase [Haloplanus aerogenes]RMB25210.1 dienelactone hydrolase [Haloplanus aerogenes]
MSRVQRFVRIPVDDAELDGELVVPADARGIVLFAHGSGSSRHSPRNQAVAERLREEGLATLLFDLLTEAEDRTRRNRFDIPLLTDRLAAVTRWIGDQSETADLPVGYFGASTGAAAALRAAAEDGLDIDAVVARGGRVDLAADRVPDVDAPCLFVVGSEDTEVLERNEAMLADLPGEKRLEVVEGAGHLFEGPGQLTTVATLAAEWFVDHLPE